MKFVENEKFTEKVYESGDFNNVTVAYEDDLPIRFTSSSLHHPVKNRYKSKAQQVKVKSKIYSLRQKNGVKTE